MPTSFPVREQITSSQCCPCHCSLCGVVFVFWPYFNSSVASPCSPLQKLQCCVTCVHFVVCTKTVKYWSRIKSLSLFTLIFAFAVYCFSGELQGHTDLVPSNFIEILHDEIIVESEYSMLNVVMRA